MVVFPDPDPPTSAMRLPGVRSRLNSSITSGALSPYPNETCSKVMRPEITGS